MSNKELVAPPPKHRKNQIVTLNQNIVAHSGRQKLNYLTKSLQRFESLYHTKTQTHSVANGDRVYTNKSIKPANSL